MKPAARSLLIWGALAATLAATVWVENSATDTESVALPAGKPAVGAIPAKIHAAPVQAGKDTPSEIRTRPLITRSPGDLFPAAGMDQAASSSDVAMEPTVPPMPFKYAGKLIEGPVTTAFLTNAQQNLLVRTGDIVGGDWKVESISPQQIHLIYMPLQTAVILDTGEEY